MKPQWGRVFFFKPLLLTRRVLSSPPQGDAILQCEHIFEAVTKLAMLVKKENIVNVVQGR